MKAIAGHLTIVLRLSNSIGKAWKTAVSINGDSTTPSEIWTKTPYFGTADPVPGAKAGNNITRRAYGASTKNDAMTTNATNRVGLNCLNQRLRRSFNYKGLILKEMGAAKN